MASLNALIIWHNGNNIIHLCQHFQELNPSVKQGLGGEISENWTFTGINC